MCYVKVIIIVFRLFQIILKKANMDYKLPDEFDIIIVGTGIVLLYTQDIECMNSVLSGVTSTSKLFFFT